MVSHSSSHAMNLLEKEKKLLHTEELLRLKQTELNSLLEITQAINDNLSARGLLELYEKVLVKQIGFKKVAVFNLYANWNAVLWFGIDQQWIQSDRKEELLSFKHLTHLKKGKHQFADEFEIVLPVYHKNRPLGFAFLGGFPDSKKESKEELLSYVQTITSIVAMAIENKKLFKEQLKQESYRTELVLGGQMQSLLIPDKSQLPNTKRLQIGARYIPHLDVGGDYYDYIQLNEDEFVICIGDISGKGIAAALLMANFQASLRAIVKEQHSLKETIEDINNKVNEITKGEKFITLFLAKYNFITHQLQYVNAGHNPPLLLHKNKVELLHEGCTIMGMFDKLPNVNVGHRKIEERALIFCYTDGLTDTVNDKKESFNTQHLAEFLIEKKEEDMDNINNSLMDYLLSFKGTQLFVDDVTWLMARFK